MNAPPTDQVRQILLQPDNKKLWQMICADNHNQQYREMWLTFIWINIWCLIFFLFFKWRLCSWWWWKFPFSLKQRSNNVSVIAEEKGAIKRYAGLYHVWLQHLSKISRRCWVIEKSKDNCPDEIYIFYFKWMIYYFIQKQMQMWQLTSCVPPLIYALSFGHPQTDRSMAWVALFSICCSFERSSSLDSISFLHFLPMLHPQCF